MSKLGRVVKLFRENTWQKLGVIVFNGVFWAGLWQLDLLVAPLVWQEDWTFLLPFNIPISAQMAYCLFFAWIIIGGAVLNLCYWFWES